MSSNARTCYSRNSTQIIDIAYQPCNSDLLHDSFCCGTNHQGAGQTDVADDVCESNGLCQNFEPYDGTSEGVKLWWRQGCTDPTWESEACLKDFCNEGVWRDENAPVRKCDNNEWCCGEQNCCDVASSLFVLAATIGLTTTSTSIASSASSPPTSNMPSSTNRAPSTPNSSSDGSTRPTTESKPGSDTKPTTQGLTIGARVGIGLGAAVTLILLLLVALLVLELEIKKRKEKLTELPPTSVHEKGQDAVYRSTVTPAELHGQSEPAELGAGDEAEMVIERQAVGRHPIHDQWYMKAIAIS